MSRTADAIRTSLLESVQVEFRGLNVRIVTAPRTPVYALAGAIALEIEGAEAEAAAARLEVTPGTASLDGVRRHADAAGIEQVQPSRASVRVRVTGTPSTTLVVAEGKELTAPDGTLFLATAGSVTFDGSGASYTTVTARDAGAAGNLALGTTLTWQGAPAGFGSTAVTARAPGDTTHMLIVGAELEDVDTSLRSRVKAWWKEKAQGGNRADWHGWLSAVEGVGDAYVWSRSLIRGRTLYTALPGVVSVAVFAPAPALDSYVQNADGTLGLGLSPAYSRLASEELRTRVRNYVEGTHDRSGVPVPSALQKQLHSAGIASENWYIADYSEPTPGEPDLRIPVDVTVALSTDPATAAWPWGIDNPSVRSVTAATTTTLTLDDVTGIHEGDRIAVELGETRIRGHFWCARVQSIAGNVLTLTQALPAAPSAGAEVRPDCGLWSAVRAAVLAILDTLGPGDVGAAERFIPSHRYPRPSDHGPDRLFTSRIVAAAQQVQGVAGVDVVAPVATVVPTSVTPMHVIVPRKVRVVPQP